MLASLIIIGGAALCSTVNALPQWPHQDHWKNKDWEKVWPGWPEPTVYTPPQPKPTWWHEQKPTKTKTTTTSPPPTSPPTITSTSTSTSTSASLDNACNSVRKLQSSITSASPSATATVPAALAYECINSVPFNSSAAVALLDSIKPYLDWQTTIQYIEDPPAEYAAKVQAPYAFWSEWERIYATASSNGYENEYEFGFDLYRTFQKTHDGHFTVYPDSSTGVFTWGRRTPLVSVSVDGTSIPEVYVYQDVLDTVVGNATYTPSPLALIDGQNSTEFLLEWAQYGSLQDPDALWNNMFYLLQQVSLGSGGSGTGTFSGGGRGRIIYPGANTTLTFANGTSVTHENFARVIPDFANITSGPDLYKELFIPPSGEPKPAEKLATSSTSSSSTSSTSTSTSSTTTIPAPGYPTPVIRQKNNLNSGYFLDGEGYDDVAVLSVASFVGSELDEVSFQAVNTYFLERAVAENKTKLIIDVSANGGGTILQGYDLFKQLFPHINPYGANRFRVHEAYDYIGQEISYFSGLLNRSLDLNDTAAGYVSSSFNYRTDIDVNGDNFNSWKEKLGPQLLGPEPDPYTPIIRWNLSDVLTPLDSGGIVVSGYGNRTNITAQKFDADNIIILTDGYCASTCTIFSKLMRQQAGIKTINLGGRPNQAITQAIGGVKGTNSLPYSYMLNVVQFPFTYEYIHSREFYNDTALGDYNDLWFYRTLATVVNARDGFRKNDPDSIPLQFQYEPADCRIYYTPEMAVDQTAAWKTVADTAFNGVDHCVAGGIESPGPYKRVAKERKKHSVRRGLQTRQHAEAIDSVWTGKGGSMYGGDCVMIP